PISKLAWVILPCQPNAFRSRQLLVAILHFAHERCQIFRKRGASGIGELGPQSRRKRLNEFDRIERDNGASQCSAPYVVNMTDAILFRPEKIFSAQGLDLLLLLVTGPGLLGSQRVRSGRQFPLQPLHLLCQLDPTFGDQLEIASLDWIILGLAGSLSCL